MGTRMGNGQHRKHANLFVAGTFDGLHKGHRALLMRAFYEGERVTIGVTSDTFIQKYKYAQLGKFAQYSIRKNQLEEWLGGRRLHGRATVIPIDDPYEPAASMKNLDALIVTQENRKTGERINVLRQNSALPSLTLIEVPMVVAQDRAPISSTRLRNGEIDHNGRLVMPESMREALGKPLGKVLKGWIPQEKKQMIITVGDIATKTFLDAGIIPALAVIDGKVGRKPYPIVVSQLRKTTPCEAKSGPGFISREAIEAIQKIFVHSPALPLSHHALLIDGEEDLLVLPVIIHAPVGSVVYYGQPNEGLVEVVVTKAKKQQALAVLGKFL